MPNCWSYGTRTQCCAARSPGSATRRPTGVAGRLVTAIAAPSLGRGLRGHARHDPGLASQAGLAQLGLHHPPPARTSPDPSGGEGSRDSDGNRESNLGTPPRAGRTGPARPSHRRLHRPPRHQPNTSKLAGTHSRCEGWAMPSWCLAYRLATLALRNAWVSNACRSRKQR
jgi:hypothetical protein